MPGRHRPNCKCVICRGWRKRLEKEGEKVRVGDLVIGTPFIFSGKRYRRRLSPTRDVVICHAGMGRIELPHNTLVVVTE